MTFEEKYAAQGRKLDELKAKLDVAIDARQTAIEKNREQIAADIDALDARIEAFNASVDAKIDAKLDEIDVKIDGRANEICDKLDRAEEKLEENAARAQATLTLDKDTAESVANAPTKIEELQKQTAGQVAVAEENARLIRARRDAKFSNAKLRTEMRVNTAKEKLSERKEAFIKPSRKHGFWIFWTTLTDAMKWLLPGQRKRSIP